MAKGIRCPSQIKACQTAINDQQYEKAVSLKNSGKYEVLANDGKKALLISKYALDVHTYNIDYADITWEKCTMRTWLNGNFYNSAFSEEEKKQILKSTVSADKNPEYSTAPGKATEDSVFLLSAVEAEKYFATDEARKCVPTEYAIAQDAYTSISNISGGKTTCRWWLRSPCCNQYYASNVLDDGSVSYRGSTVHKYSGCVRPALWINLES